MLNFPRRFFNGGIALVRGIRRVEYQLKLDMFAGNLVRGDQIRKFVGWIFCFASLVQSIFNVGAFHDKGGFFGWRAGYAH